MSEFNCKRCGEPVSIEGEYPKFIAWCDNCNDYVEGFDPIDYAREFIADLADSVEE